MKTSLFVVPVLAATSVLFAAPPETARKPVTDTYHSVQVVDDYRWLEDWSDPRVQAWSDAQNSHARTVLDGLPNLDAIRARVTEIMTAKTVRYGPVEFEGGTLFALKSEPPKQQPFIVAMPSADHPDAERVIVDPNALDGAGGTSIDWFVPSPDGKLIAVSLSAGGSESGDVHVFDTATGKDTRDTVPRVNGGTAGGSLAWASDSAGFFYSRYPRGDERPAEDMAFFTQIYFHALGTPPGQDRYELGKDFPRIAEIQLHGGGSDGRVLATVQNGDGGEFAIFVRGKTGTWQQIADFPDRIVQAALDPTSDNSLFVVSRKGAPRGRLLRVSVDKPDLAAAPVVIPEGHDTLVSDFTDPSVLVATSGRLYLTYQLGGPSEVRVFDHAGKPQAAPTQLAVATARGVTPVEGDDVLFDNTSYIDPPAWYFYDAKTGQTRKTALVVKSPVDFSDCEVVREFATSKDGTPVPVNIVRRKGTRLDGSNPCIVTGYGGYGINITPGFTAADRVLIEQGFVIAEANLRGGAEFGDAWHEEGRLTKKQNVFDDFAAAARYMADKGYTTPARTVIIGGSNGGLLMGATFTQHPEVCKAVVSFVGIYDMLRVELSPNGAFNVPEFGTVKDPALFKALYAYSPYHHVKDGAKYPDILFLTGANDPRVDPMQSRKMTARLQAASPGTLTLLRTSAGSGHGGGTALSERIEQAVDVDAFIFNELGVNYKPVK